MRTVTGDTEHVVVIGAGLGGLSATLRLLAAGRRVTLLEREPVVGGCAGSLELGGYTFDTGPTVLTLPDLIADALACVDEDIDDWLELRRLDPVYRARFADGSTIDVRPDVDAMVEEITAVCGSAAAAGYRKFVAWTQQLYDVELPHFIDRNFDSPVDLVNRHAVRLARLGGFRRWHAAVAGLLPDPRLQRLFSFQAMYAGLSPYRALALYAVIAYMDCVRGAFHPVGGMHAVPRALADAAEKHGASPRLSTAASRVEFAGDRARAVITVDGERIPCDAVIVNTDPATAWRGLLADRPAPRRRRSPKPIRYSPSCVVLHVGSKRRYADQAHHTIHFGEAWRQTFRELIDQRSLMTDPSLLVTSPTVTDPAVAPPGRATYFVLAPTPNLEADLDWDVIGGRYRDELVGRLESLGYQDFADSIEVEAMTSPADWARAGLENGTPFSAAHTFAQTGPFRTPNLAADNVVFAGAGTQPGVGVPMVVTSGKLAAERITGRPGRSQ